MLERFNKSPYQAQVTTAAAEESEKATEEETIWNTKKSVVSDDPLSQSDESAWNQHFCDKELMKVINQDVTRTFPGVEMFRMPEIQSKMANILFCYARSHRHICYRQGMHELLAPLLYVVSMDHYYLLEIKRINNCIKCEGILEFFGKTN